MTQAVLLAAGLGTRLGDLTKSTPKCLVEVGGKPMLQHWLEKLETVGCSEIYINTHHLADRVEAFVKANKAIDVVRLVHEENLLGTAGTLMSIRHLLTHEAVLVAHADNFFLDDLVGIMSTYSTINPAALMVMGVFNSANPRSCGIVQVDKDGIAIRFDEKPSQPTTNLANAAVYVFSQEALELLDGCTDLSTEYLPRMMGRVQVHYFHKPFFDIGTPTSLADAQLAMIKS